MPLGLEACRNGQHRRDRSAGVSRPLSRLRRARSGDRLLQTGPRRNEPRNLTAADARAQCRMCVGGSPDPSGYVGPPDDRSTPPARPIHRARRRSWGRSNCVSEHKNRQAYVSRMHARARKQWHASTRAAQRPRRAGDRWCYYPEPMRCRAASAQSYDQCPLALEPPNDQSSIRGRGRQRCDDRTCKRSPDHSQGSAIGPTPKRHSSAADAHAE